MKGLLSSIRLLNLEVRCAAEDGREDDGLKEAAAAAAAARADWGRADDGREGGDWATAVLRAPPPGAERAVASLAPGAPDAAAAAAAAFAALASLGEEAVGAEFALAAAAVSLMRSLTSRAVSTEGSGKTIDFALGAATQPDPGSSFLCRSGQG